MEKAVFLDRDGVIIEDIGYIDECSKIKFLPGVSEAINLLNNNGFKVIIITNQSGVARGYFTEKIARDINNYIQEYLAKKGAVIDRTYYCPHHIEGTIEEYRKECRCRKPEPGMIEKAVAEFDIDLKDSFVIGDQMSDIEAGYSVGSRTIFLAGKYPMHKEGDNSLTPDYVASDLREAVNWLLDNSYQEA
ncbi:D-glycero-alpha-D-manno-heptose-1,7-bisphosphate 7-phosphatase [Chloroflexota bacterium]